MKASFASASLDHPAIRLSHFPVSLLLAALVTASCDGALVEQKPRLVAEIVRNGEPLVAALRHYEKEHGKAPAGLPELVPAYLQHLPETGVEEWPRYQYVVSQDRLHWSLYVGTPTHAFMDFSEVSYYSGSKCSKEESEFQGWCVHEE
jgi:hypothetical protein